MIAWQELAPGHWQLAGSLNFETAQKSYKQGQRLVEQNRAPIFDLSGVEQCDSAGLATLIGWISFSQRLNRALRLTNIPPQLHALAKISDCESLLAFD